MPYTSSTDNAFTDYTQTLTAADSYMYSLQHAKDLHQASLPTQAEPEISLNVNEFGIPEDMSLSTPNITEESLQGIEEERPVFEKLFNAAPEPIQKLVTPILTPFFNNPIVSGTTIGLTEGFNGTMNLLRDVNNAMHPDNQFTEDEWLQIPELLERDENSTSEGLVSGLTQFVGVYSGLGKLRNLDDAAGGGKKLLDDMLRGGFADAAFDPEDGNLSTFLNSLDEDQEMLGVPVGKFKGPLTEYLGAPIADDAEAFERLQFRLKSMIEGAGLGLGTHAVIKMTAMGMTALKGMKEWMLDTDPESFYKALEPLGIKNPQLNLTDISGLPKNAPDIGDMFSNKIEVESVLKEKIDVNQYRKISGGSVRSVYQISKDKVVKVATHPRGLEQNALATDGFLQNNEHWPEVFETGQDYVVAEYVPRNDKVANKYLKPLKEFTAQDWHLKIPQLRQAMEEMGLDDFLNYDLLWNDFKSVRNWGVREDGTVVLIDEGAISDQITSSSKIDDFTKQAWEDVKQSRKSVPAAAPIAMTQGESDDTSNFIKSFEGYRDEGYYATDAEKDAGIVTAGYGSTRRVAKGEKITEEQAEQYLQEDIAVAEKAVDNLVEVELTPNQRTALVSLVFNVGQGNFKKSKALKALNKGDIETFIKEAFDSEAGFVRSGGKILNGLVKRRQAEKELFLRGIA